MLGNLLLFFVFVGVGVIVYIGEFCSDGLGIVVVLIVLMVLVIVVGVLVFKLVVKDWE